MKPDITLVFPSSPFLLDQAVFPPLGIMYLSAYLKEQGLSVQCLDMGIGHTPDMAESDTIGISITTPQRNEAYALARYYKGQGKCLIAGGPHATHKKNECRGYFDWVVLGEGEQNIHWILSGATSKPIPNKKVAIDDCPYPDRDALPIHDYKYEIDGVPATVIMTSRGCPYSCSFCAKVSDNFRMQSADRTVAEIEHIHKTYGFEAFMVFDDVFIASKKRLRKIAEAVQGKYIFRCFARSNLIDEEVCGLLKKMGVVEIGVGVESGSNKILHRNMKGTTSFMNLQAVDMLHAYDIRVKAFLIVGLPGESPGTVFETASWIKEARPDDVDISIFQPLPGSAIFSDPEAWGIGFKYDGKAQWYKGTPGQYVSNVSTKGLTAAEIVNFRDELETMFKPKELLR